MTARGAESQGSHWAARPWQTLRRVSDRTSLRTKLVTALFTLVTLALVAISCAGISILRSYLLGQQDQALQSQGLQHFALQAINESDSFQNPAADSLAKVGYAVWWQPAGGSLQEIVQPGGMNLGSAPQNEITSLPPSVTAKLVATPDLTTTVQGQAQGDRWRVVGFPAILEDGTPGTVIIGTDVSSVYTTIARLAGVDLIVSVAILFVLLMAGIAVVRANLRPLVDIEETAGEIADGHLNRRVPERDPRTEIGSLGRSLNIMLSQIETAFHAREESEAAAHKNEERMRRFIADASHELRTPLTAIRGFAEYYRQRGGMVAHWDKPGSGPAGSGPAGSGPAGSGPAGSALAGAGGLTPDDLDRLMPAPWS